jgi:chorismate-pyruvate lyase
MLLNKKQASIIACTILTTFAVVVLLNFAYQKTPVNSLPDEQFYVELVAVDGIGPILAARSVAYRREHGTVAVNDLIEVNGIGNKRLAEIKKRFKD